MWMQLARRQLPTLGKKLERQYWHRKTSQWHRRCKLQQQSKDRIENESSKKPSYVYESKYKSRLAFWCVKLKNYNSQVNWVSVSEQFGYRDFEQTDASRPLTNAARRIRFKGASLLLTWRATRRTRLRMNATMMSHGLLWIKPLTAGLKRQTPATKVVMANWTDKSP